MEARDKNNIADKISELAAEAMIYEVSCYPSFGLVSPVSSGSHSDMNFYTFIRSSVALIKYMKEFAYVAYTNKQPIEIFKELRKIGVCAEKSMFRKTNGINTHKGMLFLMGICCGAVAKAIYDKRDFSAIKGYIKDMTKGLVEKELRNLNKKNNLSHGEKLFLEYGCTGVRGEVESGIPIVFDYAIEHYDNSINLNENDRLVNTLVGIMQHTEDSTIIHRHDIKTLNWVRDIAKEIIDCGGMNTIEGKDLVLKYSQEFQNKNISPGGSADLLAVTVFLSLVKKEFFKESNYV